MRSLPVPCRSSATRARAERHASRRRQLLQPALAFQSRRVRRILQLTRQLARAMNGPRQPIARAHREHRRRIRQDRGRDNERERGERIRGCVCQGRRDLHRLPAAVHVHEELNQSVEIGFPIVVDRHVTVWSERCGSAADALPRQPDNPSAAATAIRMSSVSLFDLGRRVERLAGAA